MHRDVTKNCECEYCKILFTSTDILLVKTIGKRQFTCLKTGKGKYHVVNVYLHSLKSCLNGYDVKFRFESVVVLKKAMSRLPESVSGGSQNKTCK